jgi:hypothetical protein
MRWNVEILTRFGWGLTAGSVRNIRFSLSWRPASAGNEQGVKLTANLANVALSLKSDRFERRDPEDPLRHVGLDAEIRQNRPLSRLDAPAADVTAQAISPATHYRRAMSAKVLAP